MSKVKEFRIPAGEQKLVYQFKGFTASQMDELHAMLHRAGIVTTPDFNKRTITTYSNRDAMKLKKNKTIQRFIKSKGGKQIKEGTCGYGVNGKLGEEPAGPNLRKKIKDISKDKNESRNKSLGEKDLMKYLMKRFKFSKKKAIDTMKKAGFDTSMLKEAKYKGYDYKRQNRKDGLPLIVPALQKTFSNMKDLKKYIDESLRKEVLTKILDLSEIFDNCIKLQEKTMIEVRKMNDIKIDL